MRKLMLFFTALMLTLGVKAQEGSTVAERGAAKGYYPFAAEVTGVTPITSLDQLTDGLEIMIQHSHEGTGFESHTESYLTIYSLPTYGVAHIVFMQEKPVGVGVWQTKLNTSAGTLRLKSAHMIETGGTCYLGELDADQYGDADLKTSASWIGDYQFEPADNGKWTIYCTSTKKYLGVDASSGSPVIRATSSKDPGSYFKVYKVTSKSTEQVKYVECKATLTGPSGNTFTTWQEGWNDFYEFIMEANAAVEYGVIPENYGVALSNVYYHEASNEITGSIKFPFTVSGNLVQIPVHLNPSGDLNKRFAVVQEGEDYVIKVVTIPDGEQVEGNGWYNDQRNQWYIEPYLDENRQFSYTIKNVATEKYIYTPLDSYNVYLSETPTYFKLNSGAPSGLVRFSSYYNNGSSTYVSYLVESSGKCATSTSTYGGVANIRVTTISGEELGGEDAYGFVRRYTYGPSFWDGGQVDPNDAPVDLKSVFNDASHEGKNSVGSNHLLYCAETGIKVTKLSDITATFEYAQGTDLLAIMGVDIVNNIGQVGNASYADYHFGTAGVEPKNNVYTIRDVFPGEYTIRYWVCHRTDYEQQKSHSLNNTSGKITVTGANYRIMFSQPLVNGEFAANTTWFRLRLHDELQRYISAQPAYMDDNNHLKLTNNTPPSDNAGLWAVIGDAENGYKFYNRAWGAEYALKTEGSDANARTYLVPVANASSYDIVQNLDAPTAEKYKFYIKVHGTENNYLYKQGDYLATSNNASALGDANAVITFETVNMEGFESIETLTQRDLLSYYTPWTVNSTITVPANKDFVSLMQNRKTAAEALDGLSFKFANIDTNAPARTGKLLAVDAGNIKGVEATNTIKDYIQLVHNGDATFKLYHPETGKYLGAPGNVTDDAVNAANYTFQVYGDETQKVAFVTGNQMIHLKNDLSVSSYYNLGDAASRWAVTYGDDAQALVEALAVARAEYAEVTTDEYQANVEAGTLGYATSEAIAALKTAIDEALVATDFAVATTNLNEATQAISEEENEEPVIELTTDLAKPVYYVIKNVRSDVYATYAGDAKQMHLTASNQPVSAHLFYFTGEYSNRGKVAKVKIYNHATAKKCATPDSWNDAGVDWGISLSANTDKGAGLAIYKWDNADNHSTETGSSWNNAGGNGERIGWWKSNDVGSTWVFEKVENVDDRFDVTDPVVSAAPENDTWAAETKWFVLRKDYRLYVNTLPTHMKEGKYLSFVSEWRPKEVNGYWAFVGNDTDGYQIYNAAEGPGKVLNITGTEDNARAELVPIAQATGYSRFDIKPQTGDADGWCLAAHGTSHYVNDRGGYFALWESDAALTNSGSRLEFMPVSVTDADLENAITAAMNKAKQELQTTIDAYKVKVSDLEQGFADRLPLQTANNANPYYLSSVGSADGNVEGYMIDNKPNTFYGSPWGASAGQTHYWQVDLGDAHELETLAFSLVTRANGNDIPQTIEICGSTNGTDFTVISTISEGIPTEGGAEYMSSDFSVGGYRYVRFRVTETTNNYHAGGAQDEVTISVAEFALYDATKKGNPVTDTWLNNLEEAIAGCQETLDAPSSTFAEIYAAPDAMEKAYELALKNIEGSPLYANYDDHAYYRLKLKTADRYMTEVTPNANEGLQIKDKAEGNSAQWFTFVNDDTNPEKFFIQTVDNRKVATSGAWHTQTNDTGISFFIEEVGDNEYRILKTAGEYTAPNNNENADGAIIYSDKKNPAESDYVWVLERVEDAELVKPIEDFLTATPQTAGYPVTEAREALEAFVEDIKADNGKVAETTAKINAFKASADIYMPENGKAYKMAIVLSDGNKTEKKIVANGTTLSVSDDAEATTFYCHKYTDANGAERYVFITEEGNFLAYHTLTENFTTHLNNKLRWSNAVSVSSMVAASSGYITSSADERFGTVYLTLANRISGDDNNTSKSGVIIYKTMDNDFRWDNSSAPYHNGNYHSAIRMTEVDVAIPEAVQIAISTIEPLLAGVKKVGDAPFHYAYNFKGATGNNYSDFAALVNAETSVISASDYSFVPNQNNTGFYTIKSGNKYWNDAANSNNQRLLTDDLDGANSIFCYTDDNAWVNYSSGLGFAYAHCRPVDPSDGYNTFEVVPTGEEGKCTILASEGQSTVGWAEGRYVTADGDHLNFNTALANATAWTIEEVTSIPVTLNYAEGKGAYATLWSPVALNLPEGVRAYTGYVEDATLTLDRLQGTVVPANAGVVLWAPAAMGNTTYDFEVNKESTVVNPANNTLEGSPVTIMRGDKGCYSLGMKNNVVAFYNYVGAKLTGFRARIFKDNEALQGVQVLSFRFRDVTGVEEVVSAFEKDAIYDLSGRRVTTPTKGLYIVNGKKVFFK